MSYLISSIYEKSTNYMVFSVYIGIIIIRCTRHFLWDMNVLRLTLQFKIWLILTSSSLLLGCGWDLRVNKKMRLESNFWELKNIYILLCLIGFKSTVHWRMVKWMITHLKTCLNTTIKPCPTQSHHCGHICCWIYSNLNLLFVYRH